MLRSYLTTWVRLTTNLSAQCDFMIIYPLLHPVAKSYMPIEPGLFSDHLDFQLVFFEVFHFSFRKIPPIPHGGHAIAKRA